MRAVLLAGGLALVLSLSGTPLAIRIFTRRGYGQPIREDGPSTHKVKHGTPTMGGVVVILGTLLAYALTKAVTAKVPTASAVLVLALMAGLGLVGFLDDYLKVFRQRNLGLRARAKAVGQWGCGLAFAILALFFPSDGAHSYHPASEYLSFARDTSLYLGPILFVIWAVGLVIGSSNGVNLTDGADGLATGACLLVFSSYVFIGVWQDGGSCERPGALPTGPHACYAVRDPMDLAIVAAAVVGACAGFLWFNTAPAQIFLGDTGALALGGGLAGLAICTGTELLLAVLGGLFVITTLSVVLQVASYRYRDGKRIFKIAPLHHHFEMIGWPETTVVVRFWLLCGMFVGIGLALFYAGWVSGA
ncbi:phospho-N-acetylmuramoyl-pentapeptide-transferase [Catenulispora yoronensis]|uniref:phospho-N-acetylmuramoyl-pentapeptide- transferase n=1 Tax=Catenulispora yoronensis TaxID=450799 RepID=UPI0031DA0734